MTTSFTPDCIAHLQRGEKLSYGHVARMVYEIESVMPVEAHSCVVEQDGTMHDVDSKPLLSYREDLGIHAQHIWRGKDYTTLFKLQARLNLVDHHIRHNLDHNAREDVYEKLFGPEKTHQALQIKDFHDSVHQIVFYDQVDGPSINQMMTDICYAEEGGIQNIRAAWKMRFDRPRFSVPKVR